MSTGTPTIVALLSVGGMVLVFGFLLLMRLNRDNPLSPYALQVFALIVILPVLLALVLMGQLPKEATTGLLGTIIGFFFGTGRGRQGRATDD